MKVILHGKPEKGISEQGILKAIIADTQRNSTNIDYTLKDACQNIAKIYGLKLIGYNPAYDSFIFQA